MIAYWNISIKNRNYGIVDYESKTLEEVEKWCKPFFRENYKNITITKIYDEGRTNTIVTTKTGKIYTYTVDANNAEDTTRNLFKYDYPKEKIEKIEIKEVNYDPKRL